MNRPPASPRVRWRESFGAKVTTAVLGTVALLLGTTLLIVRFEMRLQVGEVVDDATERSRAAFAEIVALQEERLSDVLNPITGSRRTVAALEAALDADPSLPTYVRHGARKEVRVGRRQRKRTCWDCEREWKRMVVPLEPGRPSEARQLLRTRR